MTALDFLILIVLLANYCIAVPAFLSADSVPLILLGMAIGVAPFFIIYHRFFKEK